MGSLFGSTPKAPPVPAPAPVPTVDKARDNQAAQDALLTRRGRAASILTDQKGGALSAPAVGTKKLLGG